MNKKIYINPTVKITILEADSMILAASDPDKFYGIKSLDPQKAKELEFIDEEEELEEW